MAKTVTLNAQLKLATVNYSSQVAKLEIKSVANEVDVTNMESGGSSEIIPGLFKGTLMVEWVFDDDRVLDLALWTAHQSRTPVAFEAWPDGVTTGSGNPKYTGNIYILEYQAMTGGPGDARRQSVTYPVQGAIARAES